MTRIYFCFATMLILLMVIGCDDDFDLQDQLDSGITRINTDRTYLKDQQGRYLLIHGVNVSGSTKVPAKIDPISYVGKPFPLEEADWNFRMLRKLGFNAIRLLVIWEAIEPYGSGDYDQDYLDYIEAIVAKANEYGIYCIMDMHQDMFSRHLLKLFDDQTNLNSLVDKKERKMGAPFGLNNKVQGDGAPQWAVQYCLPEKNVGGPKWGLPDYLVADRKETTDFYSMSLWGINIFLSLDVNRCFATMFAGKDIYPFYKVDGKNIQDFLQDSYANAWAQVASRISRYPNVIGYDIINEPPGLYIVFVLYALLYREADKSDSGMLTEEEMLQVLDEYLEILQDQGAPPETIDILRETLLEYDILPKSIDRMNKNGFTTEGFSPYQPNIDAAIGLISSFNRNYLQPFHKKVGDAILEEDPNAILFLELSLGLPDTGIAGWFAEPMLRPDGFDQIVYAPHYYTDIYPSIGYNMPERDFTADEKRFRDYTEGIEDAILPADYSLGKPPIMMGEFGTYFNFGGIEKAIDQDYIVSSYILDIYFETYEEMLLHHTMWCYSSENTKENGENWNKEDFSILDSEQKPRSIEAYSRVYPRFTSGRLTSFHYYSPLHYYDPRPGEPTPYLEFAMEMESKETDAPTEIFIPPLIFRNGFYVYISDGQCAYDPDSEILYWFPADDAPDTTHTLKLRPPYDDYGDRNWDYFFNGDQVLEGQS